MEFSQEWWAWLAENLLLGAPEELIVSTMLNEGFEEEAVKAGITQVQKSPSFRLGRTVGKRLSKLEAMLAVRRELAKLSERDVVPRICKPTRQEFLTNFYSTNKPVVTVGDVSNWPACSKWCPEYFSTHYGDVNVTVSTGRTNKIGYFADAVKNNTEMTMQQYCELVVRSGQTNDHYMVANNHTLENAAMTSLFEDIPSQHDYLDEQLLKGRAFLWFGPAGTVTPLHYDTMNIVMAQIYGKKRVTLIPPEDSLFVYNEVGVFSSVDLENPDREIHPLFEEARKTEVEIGPGDLLFIPVGWWHHVRSLSVSIGVSFTNFIFPNDYTKTWGNVLR